MDNLIAEAKLSLIGGTSVGKTTFIHYFIEGNSPFSAAPTVQLAFSNKTITIHDTKITLKICDTAGQERFQSVAPNFYRSSDGAIILFDITDSSSFKKAQSWLDELNAVMPSTYHILLVGNKTDLAEDRQISYEDALIYAESNNISYMEASAKTGDNVSSCFYFLAEEIYRSQQKNIEMTQEIVDLQETETKPKDESGCC